MTTLRYHVSMHNARVVVQAGKEGQIVFLLTDNHLVNEKFLVVVNQILSTGDISDFCSVVSGHPEHDKVFKEVVSLQNTLIHMCFALDFKHRRKRATFAMLYDPMCGKPGFRTTTEAVGYICYKR